MDFSESTKVVSSRIQEIEPEHASKIVGYLLLQDCGDQDMIRLAFSPDNVIKSVTDNVKNILGLSWPKQQVVYTSISPQPNNQGLISNLPVQFNPYSAPSHSRAFSSSQLPLLPLDTCRNGQAYPEYIPKCYSLEDQFQQVLNLDEHLDSPSFIDSEFNGNCYYPNPGLDEFSMGRASRRSRSLSEFPPKVCHYYSKGFCRHGANCKYLHDNVMTQESFSQLIGLGFNKNGHGNEDPHVLPLSSRDKLELELVELLKSRKGPISIASLPMLYYEKYGRTLQAEGYLTESQRHGKVGYSLTKLLSRLKNRICLIDRPHGQHAVILAEDAPKYFDYISDHYELGQIAPGSRQIYLTFPAESTFTENDVSNYFNTYGPVQDVRIPCLQKRMFGFVTFIYQETVREILAKGNPHFICGARVLVKPYKEKARLIDRKYPEKLQNSVQYNLQFDGEYDFHPLPRVFDGLRFMRQQFMEEHWEALGLEKKPLSESQVLPKPSVQRHSFDNLVEDFKLAEDDALNADFATSGQLNSALGHLNNGSFVSTSYSNR